jgi:hypothetical protein
MKIIIKIIILNCLFYHSIYGQSIDSNATIVGKWAVCWSSKFNEYKCDSTLKYEFFDNGSYIEHRKNICDGQKFNNVPGKWTIKDNKLIWRNDKYCKSLITKEGTEEIKWIDENVFYMVGREGKLGRIIYTYFVRIE